MVMDFTDYPSNSFELHHETSQHNPPVSSPTDIMDREDSTQASDFRYEHAPLFAHESLLPVDIDESHRPPSLTLSEGSISSSSLDSTAPFPASEDISVKDIDHDPDVEVFPSNRHEIFKHIGTTKSRLEADNSFDLQLGSPPAQVLSKSQLRDRDRSRKHSRSSSSSERFCGLDAISEEHRRPTLSRSKHGSCVSQCHHFQGIREEEESDPNSEDHESPLTMPPFQKSRDSSAVIPQAEPKGVAASGTRSIVV